MKKFLLAVAVLIVSMGAAAQINFDRPKTLKMPTVVVNQMRKAQVPGGMNANMMASQASKVMKAPSKLSEAELPEGEVREFYVNQYDYVYGVSDQAQSLFPRVQKFSVVYAEDGSVYLPMFVGQSYLDAPAWIKGTLSADGTILSIESGQDLGTFQGYPCVLTVADENGNEINSLDLYVDSETGAIFQDTYDYAFLMCQDQFIAYATGFTLVPTNYPGIEAPVTRSLTGAMEGEQVGDVNTTIEEVGTNMDFRFVRGIFPSYPDGWVNLAEDVDESGAYQSDDLLLPGAQVIADDVILLANLNNGQVDLNAYTRFVYNGDGTYTENIDENYYDLFYYQPDGQEGGLYYSTLYYDMNLGEAVTGISSVEVGNNGEAVSSEYYDLSGRRVDAAAKGVNIRVDKYADGSRSAVKVIK